MRHFFLLLVLAACGEPIPYPQDQDSGDSEVDTDTDTDSDADADADADSDADADVGAFIDYCHIQWPCSATLSTEESFASYLWVYEADRTSG